MQSSKQTIDALADKKLSTQIATGTKQRLEKGDLAGAYKYTTDWATYLLSTQKGGKPAIKAMPTAADYNPVNPQNQAATENLDRAVRSGFNSLTDVAGDFLKAGTGKIGEAYY